MDFDIHGVVVTEMKNVTPRQISTAIIDAFAWYSVAETYIDYRTSEYSRKLRSPTPRELLRSGGKQKYINEMLKLAGYKKTTYYDLKTAGNYEVKLGHYPVE